MPILRAASTPSAAGHTGEFLTNDGTSPNWTGVLSASQIIPRTNTLSNLLPLAGGAGELSSATDVNAIVRHTGVAGAASSIFPYDSVRQYTTLTTSDVVPSDADKIALTIGVTGAQTLTLASGGVLGQRVRVEIIGITGTVTGTLQSVALTQIALMVAGHTTKPAYIDFRWNGSAWDFIGSTLTEELIPSVGGQVQTPVFFSATIPFSIVSARYAMSYPNAAYSQKVAIVTAPVSNANYGYSDNGTEVILMPALPVSSTAWMPAVEPVRGRCFAIPAASGNTMYTMLPTEAAWTSVTLPGAAGTWGPDPHYGVSQIPAGKQLIGLAESVSSSRLIIGDIGDGSTTGTWTEYALPSAGIWLLRFSHYRKIGIAYIAGTTSVALIDPTDATVVNTLTAPGTLTANTKVDFIDAGLNTTKVLFMTHTSQTAYLLTVDVLSNTYTWETVSLPSPPGQSTTGPHIQSNGSMFVYAALENSTSVIRASVDGVNWFLLGYPPTTLFRWIADGVVYSGSTSTAIAALTGQATTVLDALVPASTFLPVSVGGLTVGFATSGTTYRYAICNQSPSVTKHLAMPSDIEFSSATGTINIAKTTGTFVYDPGSTQATATINFPPLPRNGQKLTLSFNQIVTTLTLGTQVQPASQVIVGAPASAAVGQTNTWVYRATNKTWYPA